MEKIHNENIKKISKIFKDKILSWNYHKEGFDSFTYTINEDWIFKIPRRENDMWEDLKTEKIFLDNFSKISPL